MADDDVTPDIPIAGYGDGAAEIRDPYADLKIPTYSTPEEYVKASPQAAASAGASSKAQQIIDYAKKFLGTPYVWGGSGPLGFDCSGLTQYVFKHAGIDLPRISYQQGTGGTAVNKNDMRPGDLVLWDNSSRHSGADHVAIYIGNGQVIAAPKPGDHVKIQPLWGTYFVRRYL